MILKSLALFVFCLPALLAQAKPTASPSPFLIVLDPGHGGIDAGASFKTKTGKVITEKEITLQLARDLARELIIRGYQVILTRNQDQELPLSERTQLANRLKARVFISLHLNSMPMPEKVNQPEKSNQKDSQSPSGIETYILNHATDAASRRLQDLENSVLKDSQTKEHSASSQVSLIMKDMILDANLAPSKDLACAVQNRVKVSAKDRGVKQALFYVLLGADMPSILIEAGFINHDADRDRVMDLKKRMKLATQIAVAVDDFKKKREVARCKIE